MIGEKENNRVWVSYEAIHEDSTSLAKNIAKRSGDANGIISVAVARGGWFPVRIAGAHFEDVGIKNEIFSVTASYQLGGTPDEYTSVSRGLDERSIDALRHYVFDEKYDLWVIEAICHTGRAAKAVRDYLSEALYEGDSGPNDIHFGSMHVTDFTTSPEAPWRMQKAYVPDCAGRVITSETKPHVEYPWEYSLLSDYNESMHELGGKVL